MHWPSFDLRCESGTYVYIYIYIYVCMYVYVYYMCMYTICVCMYMYKQRVLYIYTCMCVDIIARVGSLICSVDTVILVHVYIHNNINCY